MEEEEIVVSIHDIGRWNEYASAAMSSIIKVSGGKIEPLGVSKLAAEMADAMMIQHTKRIQ